MLIKIFIVFFLPFLWSSSDNHSNSDKEAYQDSDSEAQGTTKQHKSSVAVPDSEDLLKEKYFLELYELDLNKRKFEANENDNSEEFIKFEKIHKLKFQISEQKCVIHRLKIAQSEMIRKNNKHKEFFSTVFELSGVETHEVESIEDSFETINYNFAIENPHMKFNQPQKLSINSSLIFEDAIKDLKKEQEMKDLRFFLTKSDVISNMKNILYTMEEDLKALESESNLPETKTNKKSFAGDI